MLDYVKNFWVSITTIFSYLGIAGQIRKLADSFPGVDSQEKLRTWIIKSSDEFAPVVAKTGTNVDDKIVDWINRIALNEKAFAAVYNLALLAYDQATLTDGEAVYGAGVDVLSGAITDVDKPEDAITIIMAIGVILQVISFIREWRKNRETNQD